MLCGVLSAALEKGVCARAHLCTPVQKPEVDDVRCLSIAFHLVLFRQGLSLELELASLARWPDSRLQGSSCLSLLSAGITSMLSHLAFTGGQGNQTPVFKNV